MADFMGLMKQAAQLQSKMQALQAELEHAKRTHEDAVMATQRADERRRQDEAVAPPRRPTRRSERAEARKRFTA